MKTVTCPKCKGNMIYPKNRGGIMEVSTRYKCITCSSLFGRKFFMSN